MFIAHVRAGMLIVLTYPDTANTQMRPALLPALPPVRRHARHCDALCI